MYVVTVLFALNPGACDEFLPLLIDNARVSREKEPGCQQFDVCIDPKNPNIVFLYEIYDEQLTFAQHLTMQHFKNFDAKTASMVASKQVRIFSKIEK
jgi:(4S)-4-hydroxy-5-phosphonooxypentane-2,3-dione isomerase